MERSRRRNLQPDDPQQFHSPRGRTAPDYPGAIIANHSYQVTAEWAYGVTPWMEQGLYLPVTSPYSTNLRLDD